MSIGEILTLTSNIYVHANGSSGSVASANLRGTNAYQTSVTWNGFPINSPTLGTYDLSMMNSGAIQEIVINHGASSTLFGSGTFGGAIDLINKPDWENELSINYNGKSGSFNDYYNSVYITAGNTKFQSNTNFQITSVKLDFPYYELGRNEKLYLKNNELFSKHILQNFFIKHKQNYINIGFWYGDKSKKIPGIGNTNFYNTQRDSLIRTYMKFQRIFSKSLIQVNTAYLSDFQKYSNYPNIQTNQAIAELNYRYYYNEYFTIEFGNTFSNTEAITANYGNIKTDKKYSGVIGARIRYPKIQTNLFFRKELHSGFKIKPLASLTIKYMLINNRLFLSSNFSNNFRAPTMNDRYWPTGNPDIMPESGWINDYGIQLINESGLFKYNFKTVYYNSIVNNMIQWLPKKNIEIWSPINAKKVWLRGLESSAILDINLSNIKMNASIYYAYTKSTYTDVYEGPKEILDKQLIYVPLNKVKINFALKYRSNFLLVNQAYIGKRFEKEDNNEAYVLPSFSLTNLSVGRNIRYKNYTGKLSIGINNIFNCNYRLVRSYPMPGRSFHINYKLAFKK